jgi:hypothetical protein
MSEIVLESHTLMPISCTVLLSSSRTILKLRARIAAQITDLRSALAGKEAELENVSEALLSMKDELQLLQSQDTHQAAKDLAHRNKQLSVQLERERTRARQLADELHNAQQNGAPASAAATASSSRKGKSGGSSSSSGSGSADHADADDADGEGSVEAARQEAAELRQKYALANRRMLEARAQVAQAKHDLTRLTKVLQREIGDDVPLAEVLGQTNSIAGDLQQSTGNGPQSGSNGAGASDGGGNGSAPRWVGRAQKIAVLTARLKETRAQLRQSQQLQSVALQLPAGGPALPHLWHLEQLLSGGALDAIADGGGGSSGSGEAQSARDELIATLAALQTTLPVSLPAPQSSGGYGGMGGGHASQNHPLQHGTGSHGSQPVDRQRAAIDGMERDKRAELERLRAENEAASRCAWLWVGWVCWDGWVDGRMGLVLCVCVCH